MLELWFGDWEPRISMTASFNGLISWMWVQHDQIVSDIRDIHGELCFFFANAFPHNGTYSVAMVGEETLLIEQKLVWHVVDVTISGRERPSIFTHNCKLIQRSAIYLTYVRTYINMYQMKLYRSIQSWVMLYLNFPGVFPASSPLQTPKHQGFFEAAPWISDNFRWISWAQRTNPPFFEAKPTASAFLLVRGIRELNDEMMNWWWFQWFLQIHLGSWSEKTVDLHICQLSPPGVIWYLLLWHDVVRQKRKDWCLYECIWSCCDCLDLFEFVLGHSTIGTLDLSF